MAVRKKKDTKKVKLEKSIASRDWSYAYGEIVELDEETANKWIESGIAVEVEDEVT